MTMSNYESGESMMTAIQYKSADNDDEADNSDNFNNNENKICLLLGRSSWINHMLDHVLDYIIIGLVTTTLQFTDTILSKLIVICNIIY